MQHDIFSAYKEFLLVLAIAGLVVPLFLRAGLNAILAFLIVGLVLNPDVLGGLGAVVPGLRALSINNPEPLAQLGELGVVFLLFLIGLELSLERLLTLRRLVFGLGLLQVAVTMTVISATLLWFGAPVPAALITGGALSLSSTAIVIQLLSDARRLSTSTGRASFSMLLAQDLAVIPLLMLVTVLSRNGEGPILAGIAWALLQAALAIAVIVVVGRFALRPILRMVAGTNSPDLFMAATLLIAVGTGVAASYAGLSMALGAFIAGLMLAETEYRRAIEAIIEPFKGLLLGAFFLLVGLGVDFHGLAAAPVRIFAVAALLILLKAIIIYGLARLFGISRASSFESAMLLGPCGEFAFVLFGQSEASGLINVEANREAALIVAITMIAIPPIARGAGIVARAIRKAPAIPAEAAAPLPQDQQPRVIVAGYGRVGHLVGEMLQEHNIPYLAVDADASLVARERKSGRPVYYGDATNPAFLRNCGVEEAPALAVTMDNPTRVDEVTRTARALRPNLKIIARARDERHAMRLYGAGVTEAVPETIESSLQLAEALLVETGVPMGLAIASVHERRDGFRKLLGRPDRRAELKSARTRAAKILKSQK